MLRGLNLLLSSLLVRLSPFAFLFSLISHIFLVLIPQMRFRIAFSFEFFERCQV